MNCCTIVVVALIGVFGYWVINGGGGYFFRSGGKEVKQKPSGNPRSQQRQARASASRTDSRRIAEYLKQADEATDEAWQFMSAKDGWKKEEASEGPQPSTVYSKVSPKYGKMFKLEATLDINPELIARDMAVNAESLPKWNPAFLEVKVIDELDDATAVLYNVMASQSKGILSIKSRDLVLLMRYVQRDGWFSICLVSTLHAAAPVSSYTRGKQSPGCMRFRSTGDGRSRFEWLLNINLQVSKWLKSTVESYTPAGMMQYLEYLRKHCIKLKAAAASSST